jgi:hypothetical protein
LLLNSGRPKKTIRKEIEITREMKAIRETRSSREFAVMKALNRT